MIYRYEQAQGLTPDRAGRKYILGGIYHPHDAVLKIDGFGPYTSIETMANR
jgi:hypothetical protein